MRRMQIISSYNIIFFIHTELHSVKARPFSPHVKSSVQFDLIWPTQRGSSQCGNKLHHKTVLIIKSEVMQVIQAIASTAWIMYLLNKILHASLIKLYITSVCFEWEDNMEIVTSLCGTLQNKSISNHNITTTHVHIFNVGGLCKNLSYCKKQACICRYELVLTPPLSHTSFLFTSYLM